MFLVALSLVIYCLMKIIATINCQILMMHLIMFHKKRLYLIKKRSTTIKSKQKDLQKFVSLFLKSER